MAFDLKAATPDTSLAATGFLFGADTQSATDPSIYTALAVAGCLLGATCMSGETITTDKNLINHAVTWNAGGVTFTGWKLNVTNTASASGSLLMDLQVGGSSKFNVAKDGTVTVPSNTSIQGATYFSTANTNNAGFYVLSDSVTSGIFLGSTYDVILSRDAAGVLAQRNSTNAQTFRIYNTYTDASNYERGFMRWSSNVLEIGAEAAGTGTQRRVNISNIGLANAPTQGTSYGFSVGSGTGSFSFFQVFNNSCYFGINGATQIAMDADGVYVASGSAFRFSTSTTDALATSACLTRPAAGVVGVRGSNTTTGGALNFLEQTAPSAPSANQIVIYAEDNGSGKTRLMALFNTGAAQQIAIEP